MQKEQVLQAFIQKVGKLGLSDAKAAKQIGVSSATLSNFRAGKWEGMTDVIKKISNWVQELLTGWQAAQTANFQIVQMLCKEAQDTQTSKAISYNPASGKTFAAKYFAANTPNVFYVGAVGDMGKTQLLKQLCKVLGLSIQTRLHEMLDSIIEALNSLEKPLLIIDEFDELQDSAMRVFKDLYNSCTLGVVIIGGQHLKLRITKGCNKSKQSYQEIFSRLGKEFAELNPTNTTTIAKVCVANGIINEADIAQIVNASQNDLRRVKALIDQQKGGTSC
jgi:DNA transposition AAA+ family ATPase